MVGAPIEDSRPILVLGAARRRALLLLVESCVSAWFKTWAALDVSRLKVSASLENFSEKPQRLNTSLREMVLRGKKAGTEQLVIEGSGLFASLLALPRGVSASITTSSIAPALGESAMKSLANGILAAKNADEWEIEIERGSNDNLDLENSYKHWWQVWVGLDGRPSFIAMRLSPHLVEALVPYQRTEKQIPVDKRRAAIGNEKLTLEAVLGNAFVSVGELTSLAIDDVIVLSDDHSHANYLVTASGRRVANFSLGRSGSARAVRITG